MKSDYQHDSERTLPKPTHGHIKSPEPELSNRNGDIKVIHPDGTESIIPSAEAEQISYEETKEERRAKAVERQHPETRKPEGYYGEVN
jgi:hypothetical protein